jgi:hypothetical protein
MKYFKNSKDELWAFENECFDQNGNCINHIASQIINSESLVEITYDEFNAIITIKNSNNVEE